MKVIEEAIDGAALRFSTDELRLIFAVLSEVKDGPNAFDDSDWDMLITMPRELEHTLINELHPLVARLTAKL